MKKTTNKKSEKVRVTKLPKATLNKLLEDSPEKIRFDLKLDRITHSAMELGIELNQKQLQMIADSIQVKYRPKPRKARTETG